MSTAEPTCAVQCSQGNVTTELVMTADDCQEFANETCQLHSDNLSEEDNGRTAYDGIMAALLIALGTGIVFYSCVCLRAVYRHSLCTKDGHGSFVANMAVADLILGLAILLFHALDYCSPGLAKTALCVSGNYITEVTLAETMMTLVSSVTDSYLKIVYPLRHASMVTSTKIRAGLGLTWILAAGHGFLHIIGLDWDALGPSGCSILHMVSLPYLLYGFISQFVLPLVIIASLHSAIVRIALRHRRQIRDQFVEEAGLAGSKSKTATPRCTRVSRTQWKGIVTMVMVVVVLMVCWAPYNALALMKLIEPSLMEEKWTLYAAEVSYCLYYTACLLNPIIWSRRIPEVKQDMATLCSCKKQVAPS